MVKTKVTKVVCCPGKRLLKIFVAIAVTVTAGVVEMVIPGFMVSWRKMVRMDCQNNLKQIGSQCREYAAVHGGQFPSMWGDHNFTGEDANRSSPLRCPSTGHEVGIWKQVAL